MNLFVLFLFFIILFTLELIYFKIADKYNIIDQPNHRSSHSKITIRGGGIIFSIALLIGSFYTGWQYGYFLLGLLLISLISFVDDVKTVSNKIRITIHLIAVAILFYQLNLYSLQYYIIIGGFIFAIGTINAINFMDGINGITGGYGLVTLFTLFYVNKYISPFTDETSLILSITSLLVFNFFNFRNVAKCFAGDVGSVSLAFIIVFFLMQLIIKTNNINYLLILLMYGLDAATTILFRIIRKENVFEAHRSHFYQFLANEKKIPHLLIATIYALLQVLINLILIKFLPTSVVNMIMILAVATLVFILIRLYFEGINRLFKI
ncbi:MAG TPA: hypothetical protein VL490_04795 [Mucilaginibacter sp.]|jgi:UDP-N-acetylmuramyl pentapeptide phosphotransferase/UDP-N-acetylglucosamine-1-phosphate transferase|nr:hypothetical protein [Mucilaginibacter sp.]